MPEMLIHVSVCLCVCVSVRTHNYIHDILFRWRFIFNSPQEPLFRKRKQVERASVLTVNLLNCCLCVNNAAVIRTAFYLSLCACTQTDRHTDLQIWFDCGSEIDRKHLSLQTLLVSLLFFFVEIIWDFPGFFFCCTFCLGIYVNVSVKNTHIHSIY